MPTVPSFGATFFQIGLVSTKVNPFALPPSTTIFPWASLHRRRWISWTSSPRLVTDPLVSFPKALRGPHPRWQRSTPPCDDAYTSYSRSTDACAFNMVLPFTTAMTTNRQPTYSCTITSSYWRARGFRTRVTPPLPNAKVDDRYDLRGPTTSPTDTKKEHPS